MDNAIGLELKLHGLRKSSKYIDAATTIAAQSGGRGGATSGWGRDMGEDELS